MNPQNPAAFAEGEVFHGRYRILRCINAGGMGAVYECVHLTTEKHRALKVMLPQLVAEPGMRERFELEARVTAKIESDHIVETFDAGVDEATGAPFLVMELLRGEDLDQILKASGPLEPAALIVLLSQVATALDKTHAAGIVHRDLKPQNLFLTTRDDGSPRVKILDFGVAKVVADGSKTAQQTALIGTPVFMAPEQATGDAHIGPAADRYALAHIAYTLLVGRPYWQKEHKELPMFGFMSRMIAGLVERPSDRARERGVYLPVAFDDWFLRATAAHPSYRFTSSITQIHELAAALGVAPAQTSSPLVTMGNPAGAPQPFALGSGRVSALPGPLAPSAPPSGQSQGPASSVPAQTGDAGRPSSVPPTGLPLAKTGASIAAVLSDSTELPKPAPRVRGVVFVAVGVAALGLAALGAMLLGGDRGGPQASPPVQASAVSPAASTTAPSASPAVEPVPPLSAFDGGALAAPSASASASPAVTQAARTSSPPNVRAPPPTPPAPAANCNPPYVVDAATGRHRIKPQCL